MHTPISGDQYGISAYGYHAAIAAVGATLRSLTYEGRDLVVPFEADELRPAFRGATLAPWPNRVVDGRYVFDGEALQLPLTEPGRGHALHGLAAWLAFDSVEESDSLIRLAAVIEPQAGYPWRVLVETTYALGPDGLNQSVSGTNQSTAPAPWGTGPHPYLVAGPGSLDDWSLELPAAVVLEVTEDRLAPIGLVPVAGSNGDPFDFRSSRRIGATQIDHAFSSLLADQHGFVTARLTSPAGPGVAMTWESACAWVQIHTADLPDDQSNPGHRAGLAVEPMTCSPDAFNAESYVFDTDLIVLDPGATSTVSWTIAAI